MSAESERLRTENERLRSILVRAWADHMAAFEVYVEDDEEWLLGLLAGPLQELRDARAVSGAKSAD